MDRRIKYTKKVIKESLLTLLEKKDINKITVSEVCEAADVNRATFYRYYLDIYDLLDQIKDEFVSTLKLSLEEVKDNNSIHAFVKPMLEVVVQNKELVKILFSSKNYAYLEEILAIAYDKCKEKWESDTDITDEEVEYATVHIFNGALGVINYWINKGFDKDVDEIASIIENLSYYGTSKYIYKKKKEA